MEGGGEYVRKEEGRPLVGVAVAETLLERNETGHVLQVRGLVPCLTLPLTLSSLALSLTPSGRLGVPVCISPLSVSQAAQAYVARFNSSSLRVDLPVFPTARGWIHDRACHHLMLCLFGIDRSHRVGRVLSLPPIGRLRDV